MGNKISEAEPIKSIPALYKHDRWLFNEVQTFTRVLLKRTFVGVFHEKIA